MVGGSMKDFQHPFRDSAATVMLAEAVGRAKRELGKTSAELATDAGYKQPGALSHMATGRITVPIDRAVKLARLLGLNEAEFMFAVLEQHHQGVPWRTIFGEIAREPERANVEAHMVLGGDNLPIQGHEIRALNFLRGVVPGFQSDGLTPEQMKRLIDVFARPRG
jgi:hypothetical protein